MKLRETKSVVSQMNGGLETQKFTMDNNRKAFRILLDGIYEHKIPTVIRELWSNADDSHKAAGNADLPFECHLPTTTDPEFRVRDYGVAMEHTMAMELYTKIFYSPKDDSDEFTGALGLGSKSVYSYTDSFKVIIWIEGEKRTYVAALDDEEVPTFTHVASEPSSEPRGVEVSFPVQSKDILTFKKEAELIAMGFNVPPTCTGQELEVPKKLYSGDGWAIYEKGGTYSARTGGPLLGSDCIRQGCVRYPVDLGLRITSFNATLTVDVKLGSVQVAANRESLSLDDLTTSNAKLAFDAASKKIHAQMVNDIARCTSRIEAEQLRLKFEGMMFRLGGMNWRGEPLRGYVELDNAPVIRKEKKGTRLAELGEKPKFSVSQLARSHFIIDFSDDKTKAKRQRMREFRKSLNSGDQDYCYIVVDPTTAQLLSLGRDLGLRGEQIHSIGDLPEVELDVKTSSKLPKGGTGSRTGIYAPVRGNQSLEKLTDDEVAPDGYWLRIETASLTSDISFMGRTWKLEGLLNQFDVLRKGLGEPSQHVYLLMQRAAKRLDMPKEQELSAVVAETIMKHKARILKQRKDEVIWSQLKASLTPSVIDKPDIFALLSGNLSPASGPSMNSGTSSKTFVGRPASHVFVVESLEKEIEKAMEAGVREVERSRQIFPMLFGAQPTETELKDYMEWKSPGSTSPAPRTP